MVTKLKNKYISRITFILAVITLAYASTLFVSVMDRASYLPTYYQSYAFENQLGNILDNIEAYYFDYKNYNEMHLDKKVEPSEIDQQRQENQKQYSMQQESIMSEYQYKIDEAKNQNYLDLVEKLTKERDEKIEQYAKNIKNDEQIKKEIVKRKDEEYEKYKKAVEAIKDIQYYIQFVKTKEVFTNIAGVSDIGQYINKQADFFVKIPTAKYITNNNLYYSRINYACLQNGAEMYIIVPKNLSYAPELEAKMKFYNDVRVLEIAELKAFLSIILMGLMLLCISNITKPNNTDTLPYKKLYSKVPLEIRGLILGIVIILMGVFTFETFRDINTSQNIFMYIALAIQSLFVAAVLLHFKAIWHLFKNPNELFRQWQQSITYRGYQLLKDSFVMKNAFSKALFIGMIFGMIGIILSALSHNIGNFFIAVFFYAIFLVYYLIKKVSYFNKIVKGTDLMMAGEFNTVIQEKGKGNLARLAHNINNMRSSLTHAVESQMKSERLKYELITNVSHDLKTPLTSIINYVGLLQQEGISEEEKNGYIQVLDRKAQRLKGLIEDLFEVSKVTSGAVELHIEKVDVVSLLKQTLAEFDEKMQNSTLIFRTNMPQYAVYVNADGKKTFRVFENLISNIIKYAQPHTRVYIDLLQQEEKISIIMKNISAYEMNFDVEELYERFKRGDESRHTEGSGLGLAIAKSIVDLQGGKMDIQVDGDLFKVTVQFTAV